MRKRTRGAAVAAAVSLTVAGGLMAATTANADLVTRCIGTAGAVTVPGDLVVPANQTCELDGTTVEGQVRVAQGADLIVTGGTFNDRVVLNSDSFFDALDTTIAGNIVNNSGYGVYLEGASVGGHYVGREGELDDSFFYSVESTIDGRLEATQGDVYLLSSSVGRFLSTEGTAYTDLIDSTIAAEVTISANDWGAIVSASEVGGNATYVGNGGITIGSAGLEDFGAAGINYFGGDLTVSDNTDIVEVTGNIIAGNLTGEGNDPAPTASDNRVRGDLGGQFAQLSQAAQQRIAMDSLEDLREESSARTPQDSLADRDERREQAVQTADEIGPADL